MNSNLSENSKEQPLKPSKHMNSKITRAGILFAFGILMVGHATPEDTSKLPPSSLQLLLARVPGQVADLKLVDIEDLLRNHKREIFSEDYDKKKFYLLGDLCESLEKNPQGKDLLPLLLKEITSQKAVDCPPVGWDEIMVSGKGGGIGLLMKCVLAISGEAGFNQIFDSVVSAENPVKLNILLIQVNIRGERAKYDPVLKMKLQTLQSAQLKAVIDAHLKDAVTKK